MQKCDLSGCNTSVQFLFDSQINNQTNKSEHTKMTGTHIASGRSDGLQKLAVLMVGNAEQLHAQMCPERFVTIISVSLHPIKFQADLPMPRLAGASRRYGR